MIIGKYLRGGLAPMLLLVGAAPVFALDDRKIVASPDAPEAIGPYSQAILVDRTLYASGQIGLDPKTGKLVPGGVGAQTEQVLRHLAAVLAAEGMTMEEVVQAQVYLTNLDDFAAMNEIYGRWFKFPPARATVQVSRLPRDAIVEISVIAVRKARN
jgi:2-iminobutanoate/2-iminopropanoate deaminase